MGEHIKFALADNQVTFKKTGEEFDCTAEEANEFIAHCRDKNIMQTPCMNDQCVIKHKPDSFRTKDAINDAHCGCDIAKALKAELIDMSTSHARRAATNALTRGGDPQRYKTALQNLDYAAERTVAGIERSMAELGVEYDELGRAAE